MDELTRLLLAARDGDRDALGRFVGHSQAEVWRLVAHRVGPDDADDVTQDVYVRAWRAIPAFRHDATARTWLLAIARRACVDALRHRRRRSHLTTVCGVPVGTIRSRVARAQEDLLGQLRDVAAS